MLIPREFLIDCSWEHVPINERNFVWAHQKDIPKCPVFVFVDFRSDLIGALAEDFRNQLNRVQVLSVLHESFFTRRCSPMKPDRALEEFYGSLAKLKGEGHDFADEIQKKMTFIIVGEDVFVNWFLGVLCDLNLPDSPSIVPIALGIKSNIPFSFGWEFDAMTPVNNVLETVLNHTKQIKIDSWHIFIKMEATIPTDYQELPYCLNLWHPVHIPNMENVDNQPLICGEFWNYFSFGVDDPRLYGALRFRHISRTLNRLLAKVEVLKHHGDQWKTLSIPNSIRSIVCLNLPSFAGGLNPWTKANVKKDQSINLTPSFIDDGRLEIIGSRDDMLCPKKRWIRLDQVREIRFKFIEDSAEVINMMIDGVPLKKSPLDGLDAIEISYHRQVNILVEQGYSAKSIHDS
ncbi:diacylglycerol kinase 1-like isoform X2 [Argentina anserina]|nr:diacylglycerol kinase 1-like isoform X2 [Potentilla anserina]